VEQSEDDESAGSNGEELEEINMIDVDD